MGKIYIIIFSISSKYELHVGIHNVYYGHLYYNNIVNVI